VLPPISATSATSLTQNYYWMPLGHQCFRDDVIDTVQVHCRLLEVRHWQ